VALEDELRGIPTWGWGVIAGTAALGGLWWYRKREAAATPAATATGTETDVSGLTDDQLLSAESGGGDAGTTSATTSSTSSTLSTNQLWETQAVGSLSSQGYSPIEAQSAIEAYLGGGTLDSEAQLIVNAAISAFGIPPEGIAAPVTTTSSIISVAPVTEPTVTPVPSKPTVTNVKAPKLPVPTFHAPASAATYVVKPGDNLTSIAKAHGISESSLYAMNKGIIGSNPNLIRPGQRFTL
jgi:LysM repeat protein